jgi:crossover junction endodeoxyribonuclease RuvC
MGVDPGLVATGFGVLEAGAGAVTVRDAGVISTGTGQPLEARLNALHRAVHRIIEEQAPGLLVVEDLYTEYRFPRTAILMGHARGVIYLAARQLGVAVVALTPSEVKRAMTGNGAAGKAQVQRAVQTVLGLAEPPRPSHVADALGLAATGMSRITGRLPGRAVGPAATNRLSAGPGMTRGAGERAGQAPERMTGRVGECGGHFGAPADEEMLPVAPPLPAARTRLGNRGRA